MVNELNEHASTKHASTCTIYDWHSTGLSGKNKFGNVMLQNMIPIKWTLLFASADAEQSATHCFFVTDALLLS